MLAGPLATQILGDLGADVIKVERPGDGDDTRGWGTAVRRGRRRLLLRAEPQQAVRSVDLKTEEGVATIRRLAADSDVLIENFRPGLLAELGPRARGAPSRIPA